MSSDEISNPVRKIIEFNTLMSSATEYGTASRDITGEFDALRANEAEMRRLYIHAQRERKKLQDELGECGRKLVALTEEFAKALLWLKDTRLDPSENLWAERRLRELR